jgi:hydrogenase maturation protease
MSRILVGGVGYRDLRDHSFGVALIDRLATRQWPPDVCVEDVSYNPIALVQRLQDEPADGGFGLAMIVGALQRPGRAAGTLAAYRWDQQLPPRDQIHEAITEAVTGIIALDNTLIVARHFDALPPTVVVIEVEPEAHEFGNEFTESVAAAFGRADRLVTELIERPRRAERLPLGELPPARERHSGVVWEKGTADGRFH